MKQPQASGKLADETLFDTWNYKGFVEYDLDNQLKSFLFFYIIEIQILVLKTE